MSRIALRVGSKANSTRVVLARSSFIFAWREPSTVSTRGRPSPGPRCSSTRTAASMLCCSDTVSVSHHSPNWSVNSTSHTTTLYPKPHIPSSVCNEPAWRSHHAFKQARGGRSQIGLHAGVDLQVPALVYRAARGERAHKSRWMGVGGEGGLAQRLKVDLALLDRHLAEVLVDVEAQTNLPYVPVGSRSTRSRTPAPLSGMPTTRPA